jgi:hypothetical protein
MGQASACHGCFMEILGIVPRFSMEPAVLVRRRILIQGTFAMVARGQLVGGRNGR